MCKDLRIEPTDTYTILFRIYSLTSNLNIYSGRLVRNVYTNARRPHKYDSTVGKRAIYWKSTALH